MKQIRLLLGFTKNLRKYFVIISITAILVSLLNLVMPFVINFATDWIIAVVNGEQVFEGVVIVYFALILFAAQLLSVAAGDIGGYFGDQMAIRSRQQLSSVYYNHLLSLPQHYYDNEVTGKIINRLSRAIADVTQFFQMFANNLLQLLLTLLIVIGILAWYSWPLAVMLLLMIPTNLYLTARTSVKWQKYEMKKNKHFDIASGRFAEVVGNMKLVKSFGSEKRESSSFRNRLVSMVTLTAGQSRYWHSMNAIRGIVFGVLNIGIVALLFYETANGKHSIGDMIMLLTLVQQVAFPMRNLSFFIDSYQRAAANSKDFVTALQEKPEKDSSKNLIEVSSGQIVFDKVSFAYGDNSEVLTEISFIAEPGMKLALVGESGGGKTTVTNLLMRLYDPTGGVITIDGIDITEVTRRSVRESIATVFQDATLFSGSVKENIAYAIPDANEEEIISAARAANAYSFVMSLPKGFDTEIGERGIKLSGGQRQRIAIARALLKNAPILILDEATSALDGKAEAEVQQALDRLMKGRTTIIIAHRLSTIAHVDRIVTLKNGSIDEIGSPDQLAKTDGIYSQLLKLQVGSTEAAKKQLAKFDIAG